MGKADEVRAPENTKLDEAKADDEVKADEVQAVPVASPEGLEPGLVLVFYLPDGSCKTVQFGIDNIPLGLKFSHTSPCKILKVEPAGHGERLGVEIGWVVTSVNNIPTLNMKNPKAVANLVKVQLDKFP